LSSFAVIDNKFSYGHQTAPMFLFGSQKVKRQDHRVKKCKISFDIYTATLFAEL